MISAMEQMTTRAIPDSHRMPAGATALKPLILKVLSQGPLRRGDLFLKLKLLTSAAAITSIKQDKACGPRKKLSLHSEMKVGYSARNRSTGKSLILKCRQTPWGMKTMTMKNSWSRTQEMRTNHMRTQ